MNLSLQWLEIGHVVVLRRAERVWYEVSAHDRSTLNMLKIYFQPVLQMLKGKTRAFRISLHWMMEHIKQDVLTAGFRIFCYLVKWGISTSGNNTHLTLKNNSRKCTDVDNALKWMQLEISGAFRYFVYMIFMFACRNIFCVWKMGGIFCLTLSLQDSFNNVQHVHSLWCNN